MNQIDHITINGFKSIRRLEKFPLTKLNVLIGANGSGKSNFLGAFDFLASIRQGRMASHVAKAGGANRLLHFGAKVSPGMAFAVSFRDGKNGYMIDLNFASMDSLVVGNEQVSFHNKSTHEKPFVKFVPDNIVEAGISNVLPDSQIQNYVRDHLGSWRRFHFHDTGKRAPLKLTNQLQDNRFLRGDGSNLAAFLFTLQNNHPREFSLISKTIQRVVPFFDSFQLAPKVGDAKGILLGWRHKQSDDYFDADSLSDGTLRFMALATLFLQPEEFLPSVIIVDEPELGLHPFAITLLASLMKMVAHKTQVVVATQSSLLVDHFEPQDIIIVDQVEGESRFKRFDESDQKRLTDWLEDYSLGQLWEKNELGGRPVAY